jgi:hypothetical protein
MVGTGADVDFRQLSREGGPMSADHVVPFSAVLPC